MVWLFWFTTSACAGILGFQEPQLPTEQLGQHPLDELIDHLPRVGEEWIRASKSRWNLVPAAQELENRIEHGEAFTAQQWERALLETGALRVRKRWPQGEPFAVSMESPGWLGGKRLRLQPRSRELSAAQVGLLTRPRCGYALSGILNHQAYQELGCLSLGHHSLELDMTVERP